MRTRMPLFFALMAVLMLLVACVAPAARGARRPPLLRPRC